MMQKEQKHKQCKMSKLILLVFENEHQWSTSVLCWTPSAFYFITWNTTWNYKMYCCQYPSTHTCISVLWVFNREWINFFKNNISNTTIVNSKVVRSCSNEVQKKKRTNKQETTESKYSFVFSCLSRETCWMKWMD